jgi:hypothetical protein
MNSGQQTSECFWVVGFIADYFVETIVSTNVEKVAWCCCSSGVRCDSLLVLIFFLGDD